MGVRTIAKGKYAEWLEPEGLTRIQGWARDGLDLEQIAENMHISRSTLREWRINHPAIASAIKEGRDVPDRNVENSLYKSALGYEYDEETRELRDGELCVTKIVHKTVLPNTTAQIFWLKNRKPREWRDKQETELYGKDGGAINVQSMTDDDIDKRIVELEARIKGKK
jgi:transcriptional regulator with XRE-family HTH domain